MVTISIETPAQTEARLRRLIAASRIDWQAGEFAFSEYPIDRFPSHEAARAIAFVRDETVWSCLGPAGDESVERFAVFCFHFPKGLDDSGFVGWLASTIKQRLGSGVLVVCGHNTASGGVFDYWGVPASLRQPMEDILSALRAP